MRTGGRPRIRVIVAEDHADLRFLLRQQLHRDGRFVVVGEAADGHEAVELVRRHQPDLVLLDVRMPRTDGMTALPRVREAAPDTRIVMMSGNPEAGFEARALALGADRFLDKERSMPVLAGLLSDLISERPAAPGHRDHGPLDGSLSVDDVLALVVHELRAPLTVLYGIAERLGSSIERLDTRQVEVLAGLLRGNVERLDQLVESIGELHGIDAFDVRRAGLIDLGELLEVTISDLRVTAPDHTLTLSAEPVQVRADPVRLRQVFVNLVRNSLVHACDPIEASTRAHDGRVEVRVRDHGPGVPEEERQRIFERSERGSGAAKGGMGLGLYLARRIVQAHGGELRYEEPEGDGACFVVDLPVV